MTLTRLVISMGGHRVREWSVILVTLIGYSVKLNELNPTLRTRNQDVLSLNLSNENQIEN